MNTNISVHNKILGRVAGTPFNYLENKHDSLELISQHLLENREKQNFLKKNILEELHILNTSLNNSSDQKLVQNYRRALHNDKNTTKYLKKILEIISEKHFEQIKRLDIIKNDGLLTMLEFEKVYYSTLSKERDTFKVNIQHCYFLNGIFMSSPTLYNSILKYISAVKTPLNKRNLQIELGILKYLSRSSGKTSPFSTFTSVNICKVLKNSRNIFFAVATDPIELQTKLLVSNWLQQEFLKILQSDKSLVPFFFVTINSSISISETHYKYVINKNNIETFHRLEINSILSFFHTKLSKKQYKIIDLINRAQLIFDADSETLFDYLLSCIDIGFLEFVPLSSGIDPNWNNDFLNKLSIYFEEDTHLGVEAMKDTMRFLNEISNSKEYLEPFQKEHLFQTSQNKITQMLNLFNIEQSKGYHISNSLFFEDARNNYKMSFQKNTINEIGEKIYNLYLNLGFLDFRMQERMVMFNYFIDKYPNNYKVDFLTFYEDYYKDVKIKKENKEVDNEYTKLSNTISGKGSLLSKYVKLKGDWITILFKQILPDDINHKEVHISLENLNIANKKVGFEPDQTLKHSVGVFAQFGFSNDKHANKYIVLNSMFYGYGKMFSRFLHLFPASITKGLLNNNRDKQKDNTLYAEINDSSFHNANLHPSLLPNEVVFPGGHKRSVVSKQIPVSDIEVRIEKENQSLQLFHKKNGKAISPLDIGFQALLGRSEMFQLLNNFSFAAFNSYSSLVFLINSELIKRQKDLPLILLPRIVFERDIFIQRKTWLIHRKILPIVGDNSEQQFFFLIQEWLKEHNLPNEVFIRLSPKHLRLVNATNKKINRENSKPQYINFSSPMFILLLQKLINKVEEYIEIEEMLPTSNDLLQIGNSKYISEYYILTDKK